ncbi:MAG: ABC transporter ATP-binding protein [Candidatus Omnitrophica bacterium]|nr:ABC transporter ATP-binding protein [Candidatus Omnitrophota bacterium]
MNILTVTNLRTYIKTTHGIFKAVDGVSFDIHRGEVFGLVGESGSGKSMTALSMLKLLPLQANPVSGEILFGGRDIMLLGGEDIRRLRGSKISLVFQEPSSALNPVLTAGYQLEEAILAHRPALDSIKSRDMVMNQLEMVHIDDPLRVFRSYPHQLSGGIKQRVMIAMALINSPELVILDEPTTALDVTIQAQILDLLDEIIEKSHLSILFISHDFGVISRMCDRVGVMHRGKIVETGDAQSIIASPKETYTKALLESVRALE